MSLLSDGSSWLSDVFRADEDISVEYTLAELGETVAVFATVGAQTVELEPGVFATQRTQNRDFLIDREDLVFLGSQHTPVSGDRIEYTLQGTVYTYEAMEVPGEGAWRWHDDYHKTYRIHGTLVSAEEA